MKLNRRIIIGIGTAVITLAIMATVLFYPFISISEEGEVSLSLGTRASAAELADIREPADRGYYLCSFIGTGTPPDDGFRPCLADIVEAYSMIDLRPDYTVASGWCFVAADYPGEITVELLPKGSQILKLSDSIKDPMPSASKVIFNSTFSASAEGVSVGDFIADLLINEAKKEEVNIRPLLPGFDGEYRIYMNGLVWGAAEPELTHFTQTESWDCSNADDMSCDLTWDEFNGDIDISSNTAYGVSTGWAVTDTTMTSDDHYAEAEIYFGATEWFTGTLVRFDSADFQGYAGGIETATTPDHWKISRWDAISPPTYTDIALESCSWGNPNYDTLKTEAIGSTIKVYMEGTEYASGTDSTYSGSGQREVGVHSYGAGMRWDNYEASEVATADISNTPSTWTIGTVYPSTTYWSNGSEPSWPLTDGDAYFTVTNNSGGAVSITAVCTNFSGGVGWTLAGSPASNTVTLSVFEEGDGSGDGLTLTTSPQSFISGLAASGDKDWEIKLQSATAHTDAVAKSATLTLSATLD